ncbi:MAG: DUF3341 domain-containing protein [Dehalococcoidia bacterium]|nr:DUF3341 domain-containing protein [Dehalococcoidia bacterium]
MANTTVLGVYESADNVADAVSRLRQAGYGDNDFDIYSGTPYPEGSFGEKVAAHRLYLFPLIGALCGFTIALLITAGTQLSFPMVTGGKPILSIPPMLIIMYEGTMLGAILFTVIGVIFESRLPRFDLGVYDTRITQGYIGVIVSCPTEKEGHTEQLLKEAGALDIKKEERRAAR